MTVLCLALGIIYEFLGHGVYSWRLRLLFLIPLFMFFFCLVLKKLNPEEFWPSITCIRMLAACEIAGNAFVGIVRVYGTVSSKAAIFDYCSLALFILLVAVTLTCVIKRVENPQKRN